MSVNYSLAFLNHSLFGLLRVRSHHVTGNCCLKDSAGANMVKGAVNCFIGAIEVWCHLVQLHQCDFKQQNGLVAHACELRLIRGHHGSSPRNGCGRRGGFHHGGDVTFGAAHTCKGFGGFAACAVVCRRAERIECELLGGGVYLVIGCQCGACLVNDVAG